MMDLFSMVGYNLMEDGEYETFSAMNFPRAEGDKRVTIFSENVTARPTGSYQFRFDIAEQPDGLFQIVWGVYNQYASTSGTLYPKSILTLRNLPGFAVPTYTKGAFQQIHAVEPMNGTDLIEKTFYRGATSFLRPSPPLDAAPFMKGKLTKPVPVAHVALDPEAMETLQAVNQIDEQERLASFNKDHRKLVIDQAGRRSLAQAPSP
eukprot:194141_1